MIDMGNNTIVNPRPSLSDLPHIPNVAHLVHQLALTLVKSKLGVRFARW